MDTTGSMPGEVEYIYAKFVREEIDRSQARRILLLMEPESSSVA